MIEAKKILTLVRLELNDYNEADHSDFEILKRLNSVLNLVGSLKILEDTDYLTDKKALVISNNSVDLPNDYLQLIEVTDTDGFVMLPCPVTREPKDYQYKIMGEKLYTAADGVVIFYKKYIAPVSAFTENINLPSVFTDILVKATALALAGGVDNGSLMTAINDMVLNSVPLKQYGKKKIIPAQKESGGN